MRKIVTSFFFFLLCICSTNASEVNLNSKRYILYNLNDSEIIDSKKEHERTSIASLTKIMTSIVAIENIKDFNKKVTITSNMIDPIAWDVVKAGFKKGEKVTYNDLLYGTLLPSGADAALGLSISISGSEKEFVKLMNKKVKELNLKNTSFSNVVGLYGKNNYSTAYDMAQILKYALNNPKFKSVFETKQYKLSNGKTIYSTLVYYNKKLNTDISIIKGSKTGYIEEAMYCLASTSSINGVNYLFVSLNAQDNTSHIKDHIKEYKYFSSNYSYKDVINKEDKIFTLKTRYAKEKYISIYSNDEIKKYLKNTYDKKDNTYIYNGIKEMDYFDQKEYLGNLIIQYNNSTLGQMDLDFDKELHFDVFEYIKDNNVTINSLIFIVMIFIYLLSVILINEVDNKEIKS